MKVKIQIITLLLIIHPFLSFGQKAVELNSKYFFKLNNSKNGSLGTFEIHEYINYDLYKKLQEARKNKTKLSIDEEYIAFKTAIFYPKNGKYFLNNIDNNQKLWFSIDEKGDFIGTVNGEILDYDLKLEYYTFQFLKGKLISADIKDTQGNLTQYLQVNDSISTKKSFNEKNKLILKTTYTNKISFENSIIEEYYENGNLKSEDNYINKFFKKYNENGTPKYYKNEKTNEEIVYNDLGIIQTRKYQTKNERCLEYFYEGIIYQRSCTNLDHSRDVVYSFKDGKLEYYFIYELDEKKKYDKNKNLISSEEYYRFRTGTVSVSE